MKLIPTKLHGVLDYAYTVLLFALPRVLGWGQRVTALLTVLAIGGLIYSLLTRYELGAFRVLPMKTHLVLDMMVGAVLVAVALLWGDEPAAVRIGMGALGAFELGAALVTDPEPSAAVEPGGAQARSRSRGF